MSPHDLRTGRIVVADDDPVIRDVVRRYLERAGMGVTVCADGGEALAAIDAGGVDLAVLDVMMPVLDGIELTRRIRAGQRARLPVVLLTALGSEEDRIAGLEVGADDYVVKPFSARELALRVTGLLRRAGTVVDGSADSPRTAAVVTANGLEIDPGSRQVRVDGRPVGLTGREFDLLEFFVRHPGTAYDRGTLLELVWGWSFGDHSTVTVHVRRLRSKLGNAQRIVTVWGRGYRWDTDSGGESGGESGEALGGELAGSED